MRKIMNLPEDTTIDDLNKIASWFNIPVAIKLREHLELWVEDGVPARTC